MAKLSVRKMKSGRGIEKFKCVVEKIQKRLLNGRNKYNVPEDVKEGHFAVIAEGGEEPKRFVLPLKCLTNPTFLGLLEQAAEEYGFDHEGALSIPCRPSELQRILAQQWHHQDYCSETTIASNKSMIFQNYSLLN